MDRKIFCKEEIAGLTVTPIKNKTIILPFDESQYASLYKDRQAFKAYLMSQLEKHPELFPDTIAGGWSMYGSTRPSIKFNSLQMRRIKTKSDGQVWQIHPSFVMPAMVCDTECAEKILFLSRWAPAWALGRVFGKDKMMIHRLKASLGRYSLVGTTVRSPYSLPKDLGADEKHSKVSGEKVYIATTVGEHCFLGASVCIEASEKGLTEGYRQFKREAEAVDADYNPDTVNTDGWPATKKSWTELFPHICVIQCFLHAVLNIKNAATKYTRELADQIIDKAWDVYKAVNKLSFAQRIRRLREWCTDLPDGKLKKKALKLCDKKMSFSSAYEHPTCQRTSNMVDRLMQGMDRYLFVSKYFHGTLESAEYGIRAYCLMANFRPYNPATVKELNGVASAFERINGFCYHENWLHNLMISTSIQPIYRFQHKTI